MRSSDITQRRRASLDRAFAGRPRGDVLGKGSCRRGALSPSACGGIARGDGGVGRRGRAHPAGDGFSAAVAGTEAAPLLAVSEATFGAATPPAVFPPRKFQPPPAPAFRDDGAISSWSCLKRQPLFLGRAGSSCGGSGSGGGHGQGCECIRHV